MKNKEILNYVSMFHAGEKSVYIAIIIIGIVSIFVGLFFLFVLGNNKYFGCALLVLGFIEVLFFAYNLKNYSTKETTIIEEINNHSAKVLISEKENMQKALKTFVRIKVIYALMILVFSIIVSYSNNNILNGVLTALIIHLALAITVDNFAEINTKKYFEYLTQLT